MPGMGPIGPKQNKKWLKTMDPEPCRMAEDCFGAFFETSLRGRRIACSERTFLWRMTLRSAATKIKETSFWSSCVGSKGPDFWHPSKLLLV